MKVSSISIWGLAHITLWLWSKSSGWNNNTLHEKLLEAKRLCASFFLHVYFTIHQIKKRYLFAPKLSKVIHDFNWCDVLLRSTLLKFFVVTWKLTLFIFFNIRIFKVRNCSAWGFPAANISRWSVCVDFETIRSSCWWVSTFWASSFF